jgi:predicted transcriptional regulator
MIGVMDKEVPAMPERTTATAPAGASPMEIRAGLHARPLPGTRYRMTVEPVEETDAGKAAALREHVMRGLAEADAGELVDEDAVFTDLQKKYPDPDA